MKPGNAGGGKVPQFKGSVGRREVEGIGMRLQTPEKVQKLQKALHAKAKGSPDFRRTMVGRTGVSADLGYSFGRCYSAKTGRSYLGTRPSKQSIKRVCRELSDLASKRLR